jgi:hypothetical protein
MSNLTHSRSEALEYAAHKLAYCDSMLESYRSTSIERLRSHVQLFLTILQTEPDNRGAFQDLLEALRLTRQHEVMGWGAFTDYVAHYIERLVHAAWSSSDPHADHDLPGRQARSRNGATDSDRNDGAGEEEP